jgi:hypothetical protein
MEYPNEFQVQTQVDYGESDGPRSQTFVLADEVRCALEAARRGRL